MNNQQPKIEKLISELCPNGVEFKNLGEVVNILDSQRKPVAKSRRTGGEYPYYGANGIQDYVDDYIFDGTFLLLGEDGSVINKDGSPVLNWASGKIWVNNHAHILSEKSDVALLRYVYFALSEIDVTKVVKGNIPKITQQNLRGFRIPVPPLAIQEEIVKILNSFTELEAELEAELEVRKKQYNYYRDNLVAFKDGEVEWKALGEVAETYDGTHQTPKYTSEGVPFVSVENIKDLYNTKKCISVTDFTKYKYKPQKDDLFMTRIGDIGTCSVVRNDEPLAYYVTLTLIRPDHKQVLTKYLKFIIESGIGKSELRKRTLVNATPIKINLGEISKIKIPIPSLEEQKRVVSILNNFEALTNDISVGIPAELKARRSQYEYYRGKLLTFNEYVS